MLLKRNVKELLTKESTIKNYKNYYYDVFIEKFPGERVCMQVWEV